MRFGFRLIAALLLALLAAWPATALASGVIIGPDPQATTVEDLRLTVPPDAESATFTLYLRNTSDAGQAGLALLAYLEDATGQPVTQAGLAFRTADGAALGSFDLRAGELRRINLEVKSLSSHGVFTGTILLRSPVAPGGQAAPAGAETAPAPGVTAPAEAAPAETASPEVEAAPAAAEEVLARFTLIHGGKVEILDEGANRSLAFESAGESFSFPLTLHETTGQAEIKVLPDVGPLTRTDGVAGAAAEIKVTPAELVTLSPGGYRTVTLAGRLPDATAYRGWLSLTVDGQVQPPYTLAITRAAGGRLGVLEAGEAGDVALSVRGPSFQRAITLRVPAGKPSIADLLVEVTGLARLDGKEIAGEKLACSPCAPERLALSPGVAQRITLVGTRFQPASYQALLRLGYEGQSEDVPLILTREAMPKNIEMDPSETVAALNWVFGQTTADVPIHIREVAGQRGEIYYPDAGSLTLTTPDSRDLSVAPEQVAILRRNSTGGLEFLPVPGTETADVALLRFDGSLDLVYRVAGIGTAGVYQGKVTVTGPDSQSTTQNVKIQVKHAWPFALLAIIAGVMLSYFWHQWTKEGRSRALLGRDIARVWESVAAVAAEDAAAGVRDDTWSFFLDALDDLAGRNRDKTVPLADGRTEFTRLETQRGHYVRARLAFDQALAVVRGYPTFPSSAQDKAKQRQTEAEDQLASLQRLLKTAGTPEQAQAAVDGLEVLLKTVGEEAISLPAQNLVTELEALIQQSADRPKVRAEAIKLKEEAEAIVSMAAAAATTTAAGGGAGGLAGLFERLRVVKEMYARLRIDLLAQDAAALPESRLAAPEGQWQPVENQLAALNRSLEDARERLKAGLIDDALFSWNRANNEFLGACIYQLDMLAGPLGHPHGMSREEWAAEIARVPSLRNSIKAADEAWTGERYEEALKAYAEAKAAFLQVRIAVLRKQMAAFVGQAGRPAFLAAEDLDRLWHDGPGRVDVGAAVAGIDTTLAPVPAGGTPAATPSTMAAFRSARLEFAAVQHRWLAAARGVLAALHGQTAIPDKLEQLNKDLAHSGELLARLQAPGGEDEAALLLAEQRIYEARRRYVEGVEAFAEIYTAPVGKEGEPGAESFTTGVRPEAGSGPSAGAPPPAAWAPAGGLSVAAAAGAAPRRRVALPAREQLEARIRRMDWLVLCISLFIAAISGLAALYLVDPDFGSIGDYITAILWGFGIQAGTQLAAGGAGAVPKVGAELGIG